MKNALKKVEQSLRECGLKKEEAKAILNFLKAYLKLKEGKKWKRV